MRGIKIGVIISLVFWAVIYLSACSFKLEFGYHGETALDNKNYSSVTNKRQ